MCLLNLTNEIIDSVGGLFGRSRLEKWRSLCGLSVGVVLHFPASFTPLMSLSKYQRPSPNPPSPSFIFQSYTSTTTYLDPPVLISKLQILSFLWVFVLLWFGALEMLQTSTLPPWPSLHYGEVWYTVRYDVFGIDVMTSTPVYFCHVLLTLNSQLYRF